MLCIKNMILLNWIWDLWGFTFMQQPLTESPRTGQPSLWTCCQPLEEPWDFSLGSPSSVQWRLSTLDLRLSEKCSWAHLKRRYKWKDLITTSPHLLVSLYFFYLNSVCYCHSYLTSNKHFAQINVDILHLKLGQPFVLKLHCIHCGKVHRDRDRVVPSVEISNSFQTDRFTHRLSLSEAISTWHSFGCQISDHQSVKNERSGFDCIFVNCRVETWKCWCS